VIGAARRRGPRMPALVCAALLAPALAAAEPPAPGRPTTLAPAAQAVGPLAPAAPVRDAVYERDVVEVDPSPGVRITELSVDNRLGAVRIEGHDRETIVISALKRAPDAAILERLKVTLIPDPNGPVRISTSMVAGPDARPIPGGAVEIDLVIRAPRSAQVKAQVWNDRLTLIGMENGAELVANDGEIGVQNASGTIVTHSAAGTQRFVEVVGKVDAQLIHGEVDLAAVRGERLDASVHEGSIEGRQVRVRQAWVRTIRGNIRFEGHAMAGGQYRIASVRGDIEVTLVATAPMAVEAHASAGTVTLPANLRRSRQPRSGMEGAVVGFWPGGRGEQAAIELRSRLGNIRFSLAE
jgi:Putative adhesin